MKRAPQLSLPSGLIIDFFAGGGGASTGIEMALGRSPDIAINHDATAVRLHARNHPRTRHFCEDVFDVDPIAATRGRPVALAWFSPDCTFHSKARGGKPFRDPDRARRRRGLAEWLPRITRRVPHAGNHKYAFALDRRMRRHLPASLAYPKFHHEAA